jgi:hypothetical protein
MIGNSYRRGFDFCGGHECNSQCFWGRRIARDFKRHRIRYKHVSRLFVAPCVDTSSRFNILSDIQPSLRNTLLLCPGRGEMLLAAAPSHPFQSINHGVYCFSKDQLHRTARFFDQGLSLPRPRTRPQNLNLPFVCYCLLYNIRFSQLSSVTVDHLLNSQKSRYDKLLKTAWRRWSRLCTTSRKVAGSVPDMVIEIFHWLAYSGHTVTLEATQPLTDMSVRDIVCEYRRSVTTLSPSVPNV